MYDSLKTCLVCLTSYFMKNFRRNIIVRIDEKDSLNSGRIRKKKTAKSNFFFITLFDVSCSVQRTGQEDRELFLSFVDR